MKPKPLCADCNVPMNVKPNVYACDCEKHLEMHGYNLCYACEKWTKHSVRVPGKYYHLCKKDATKYLPPPGFLEYTKMTMEEYFDNEFWVSPDLGLKRSYNKLVRAIKRSLKNNAS